MIAAGERFLDVPTPTWHQCWRQCGSISIDAEPDQAVWADGEHIGRTPLTAIVTPDSLTVVVP